MFLWCMQNLFWVGWILILYFCFQSRCYKYNGHKLFVIGRLYIAIKNSELPFSCVLQRNDFKNILFRLPNFKLDYPTNDKITKLFRPYVQQDLNLSEPFNPRFDKTPGLLFQTYLKSRVQIFFVISAFKLKVTVFDKLLSE